MRIVRKMSMPLLGKELVEQAARPRTYVVRALYALVLFAISATLLHDLLRRGGTDCWNLVGTGRYIVEQLVTLQLFGIYLFLPAMLAGAIAGEKERESLALLFLTDMGPWEILLQKYLGRLIPMFSFLMLVLPVLAVAYALGGLETGYLLSVVWSLLLTCLQVGALALLCSVLCRTTVGALVSSYVSLAALYLLTLLLMQMLDSSRYGSYPLFGVNYFRAADLLSCLLPVAISNRGHLPLICIALCGVPPLCSTALFLFLTRYFLVRRAFAPARNPLLGFFRRLDRIYQGWNKRLGGYTLGRTDGTLPEGEPVAWRELQKRSLGRIQYLVRLGLWIEIPLVGGIFLLGSSGVGDLFDQLFLGAWVLAALFLTVQGANTIVAERTQQSLEVLLTTTLTSNEIVRQKMRALYRLCLLLAIPLLTVAAGVCVQNYFFRHSFELRNWLIPAVSAVLCVVIYLPMLAWFSMWIGLLVRTRARAILLALLALVLWCVAVPGVLVVLQMCRVIELDHHSNIPIIRGLVLLSPAAGVILTAFGWDDGLFNDWWLEAMILNFALYAVILFRLRYCCLRNADWWLRQEGKPTRYPSPLKDYSA